MIDLSRLGAVLLKRRSNYPERLENSPGKIRPRPYSHDMWAGEGAWRIIHRILGSLVLALGLINISLGVFLAVLPLAVWVVWYVYMSILVIIIFLLEILACFRHRGVGKGGSLEIPGKQNKRRIFFFLKIQRKSLCCHPERMIEYTIYDTSEFYH